MTAAHKVYYTDDCCDHIDYYKNSPYGDDTSGRDVKWRDGETDWKTWTEAPGPIVWSYKAAQWKTW